MRSMLAQTIQKRQLLDENINELTNQIIDMYNHRRSDLIKPVEISIPDESYIIGQSIGKLGVWHNTGATIIGVIQGDNIIISPGPYYEFSQKDKILIVGDHNVIQRFNVFISNSKQI